MAPEQKHYTKGFDMQRRSSGLVKTLVRMLCTGTLRLGIRVALLAVVFTWVGNFLASRGLLPDQLLAVGWGARQVWRHSTDFTSDPLTAIAVTGCVGILVLIGYLIRHRNTVYVVDYATAKPDAKYFVPQSVFMNHSRDSGFFDEEGLEFQRKLLCNAGLGEETFFPEGVLARPPKINMDMARHEFEYVAVAALKELFETTKISPKSIDVLVVNCSLFCPTPSLSAIVINRFGMKEDIRSFNLGGMGCSASPIAIELACDILNQRGWGNAIVISTENITQNWYRGKQKGMLISNVLFRMGGAAILLSNKPWMRLRSRARVLTTVRIHRGCDGDSHKSVYQEQDEQGHFGVRLSKEIVVIAGSAIQRVLYYIGRGYFPYHIQLRYFLLIGLRKLFRTARRQAERNAGKLPGWWTNIEKVASLIFPVKKGTPQNPDSPTTPAAASPAASPANNGVVDGKDKIVVSSPEWMSWQPDFEKVFDWFCIHCAGKKIIEVIQERMHLRDAAMEPSYATLYNFGNVSSATLWYELDYIERVLGKRVRAGQRVLMLAFGSGFKCNAAVLEML